MLTRCPACETHFRVTADQLKLRAGRVRCGECQHVFNALDTLIEEAPVIVVSAAPTTYPVPETPPPAPELPSEADVAVPPAPTFETPATEEADAWQAQEAIPPLAAETIAEEIAARPATAPDVADEAETGSAAPEEMAPAVATDTAVGESTSPPPAASTDAEVGVTEAWDEVFTEPPPPRRWPWVVGSLLALLALLAQATFVYRVELAVLWPDVKPALVAVCEALGCQVGLPAKVGLVGIESSDLHPDAAQKGRLGLAAMLRNRAPFAQAYPHVEITLTDTADTAILRKVLAPADYLPRGTALETGMPPQADVAVNLTLDVGALPASGYRLYIFYP